MAISAGDVVFSFLGNSQDLDAKFDQVGPKAQAAFEPAAEAGEEAGARIKTSLYEARAEVGLLGEELGIRLPRHVRGFVAELPGVGTALTAAFSATAVLFLIQALAQGTEKLSDWIGQAFIFTDAMKQSNETIAKENEVFTALNKQYDAAKDKLDELKGVTKDQEQAQIDLTKATIAQAEAQLTQLKTSIASRGWWENTKTGIKDVVGLTLSQLIPSYEFQTQAEKDLQAVKQAGLTLDAQRITADKNIADEKKNQAEATRQRNIKVELAETENFKKIALASATSEEDKFQISQFYEEKKLELIRSLGAKEKQQLESLAADIEAQQIEHAQKIQDAWVKMLQLVKQNQVSALDSLSHSAMESAIALTPLQQAMEKGEQAAHDMRVTLRTDMVASLERAKTALKDFLNAGIVDPVAFKAFEKQVAEAQKALDNFGKAEDTFKFKSHGLWRDFQTEAKTGAVAMDAVKQSGITAFDDLSKNIEGAFGQIVLGEGNVAKSLERATASSLASIASQAAVKAIFYTGEGLAALASMDGAAATNYFAAAGEMAAVAGAAGIAGRALSSASGGGSGSNGNSPASGQQEFGSGSNTGGGVRGTVSITGVQKFADGGLISGPTLSLVGEAGREAVLPLDHPDSMEAIGAAVAKHVTAAGGAGGGGIHVHVAGMISPDNLSKVVDQINKKVARGQLTLNSSNTLRVTKRSA